MGGVAIILALIALVAFVVVSTGVLGFGGGAAKKQAEREEPSGEAGDVRPVHRRMENDDGASRSDKQG